MLSLETARANITVDFLNTYIVDQDDVYVEIFQGLCINEMSMS